MPHAVSDAFRSEEEVLHVFNLPQLYTKPPAQELLRALSLLSIQPLSWDCDNTKVPRTGVGADLKRRNGMDRPKVAPEGVTKYLTSIVASGLRWIKDQTEQEEVWEQASLRLAERSGRTAMPAMSRTFSIPIETGYVDISIYEPSLTADNLGFKTWAASYLLAKRLHLLNIPRTVGQQLRILELGSGTGLVGMAAAAVLKASVLLTDLPDIERNLAKNTAQNRDMIKLCGGAVETAVLDWGSPEDIKASSAVVSPEEYQSNSSECHAARNLFPVILAADSIYSADHPAMLVGAIAAWLSSAPEARVIVELPRRAGYEKEREEFRQRMHGLGLAILDQGDEVGYDDWGGIESGELQQVECWWSVWGWSR